MSTALRPAPRPARPEAVPAEGRADGPSDFAAALAALAKKGNPFRQQFARNSDDPFCARYHVENLFAGERSVVAAFVESFRGRPDQPTGVLPLLGARGAGKTHLLHWLKHGPGVPPQLFVTPGTFRIDASGKDSSFLEYVLYQFINVLLAGSEQRGVRPLVYIGEHLTRQVLAAALAPDNADALEPLGGVAAAGPAGRLAADLKAAPRPCAALAKEAGLDPAALLEVVRAFLGRTEPRDLKGVFRRRLLEGFIRATLLREEGELADFLTDGFADVPFLVKPTRSQLALSLLQAMTELIVGSGIPVAVAFDQLEELLYGQTDDDVRRASDAFFGGVVQVMSQVPGLGLLLFVEEGLWNRIVPPLPSHILDRIHEPVHLPGHGMVRTVRLSTPTVDQLVDVVRCRVRRTLGEQPALAEALAGLPPEFPFARPFLAELAGRETVLRLMLQGCCNRLDELFNDLAAGKPVAAPAAPSAPAAIVTAPTPSSDPWPDLCERWGQEVRAAERKLKPVGSLAGATTEIQAGLGRWLQLCRVLGVEQDDWQMTAVEDPVPVGDHPTYGSLTAVVWTHPAGAARRVGVGMWLGRGVGKPKDLETKLAAFAPADGSPPAVDHLILFRPADDSRLSGRTQAAWDEATKAGHSVRVEAVGPEVFAKLYAFPRWFPQVQEAYAGATVPEAVYVHLAEQTEDVMGRLGLPQDAILVGKAA